MKNQLSNRKQLWHNELVRRNSAMTNEPAFQRINRLFNELMFTWTSSTGVTYTRRSYFVKYDRAEYSHYLRAIKLNRGVGHTFGQGCALNCNTNFESIN